MQLSHKWPCSCYSAANSFLPTFHFITKSIEKMCTRGGPIKLALFSVSLGDEVKSAFLKKPWLHGYRYREHRQSVVSLLWGWGPVVLPTVAFLPLTCRRGGKGGQCLCIVIEIVLTSWVLESGHSQELRTTLWEPPG